MNIKTSYPHKIEDREHVWIPMRDGKRLAARIWMPVDAQQDPVPAILEYIPYRKRDNIRARDTRNHPYLAGHGYAAVRVDLRGSGDSEGIITDQYRPQEQEDGLDAIAWLAQQPWCNGKVGMMGISWGGFNALQIAAHNPPALGAIISACSTDDLYEDNMHYMGGCLLSDNLSESSTMFAFNSCPPDPAYVGDRWRDMWIERLEHNRPWLGIWLQHQRRDAYWRHGSVCENYGDIQCPVLAVGGWADGYTNAVLRLLEHLDAPRKGWIGPWSHKYPHKGQPGPAIGFLQEVVRWFDHWLKGEDNGVMQDPMLQVWMQDSSPPDTHLSYRPGRWVSEPEWPSPRLATWRFGIAPDRLLPPGEHAPDVSLHVQSPTSVGMYAGKWCSYQAVPDLPHDQRLEDGGALVFESAPLDRPWEILGRPVMHLELTANEPVAMVAVRLSDVHPDGSAGRVTYGLLNLTHHPGHDTPEPLVPGKRYQVSVAMNAIAQHFPIGNRLRISISTSYWPLVWLPPRPVRLDVCTARSSLELPVRDAQPEDEEAVHLFGEPEAAEPLALRQLTEPQHNWRLIHDLAKDTNLLEVINNSGRQRIVETGTEMQNEVLEWHATGHNDPDTIYGETKCTRIFRRGTWHVQTVTRTTLTSDARHFYLHAELDAWEGQERIFSRNWSESFPRDLV